VCVPTCLSPCSQLKFASSARGRLGEGFGCEWYARGDGTTALFLTTDAIAQIAATVGLEVESLGYDQRLIVNRAENKRMHRSWIVGCLRKPPVRSHPLGRTTLLGHERRIAMTITVVSVALAAAYWVFARQRR
jgi:hypothetical protein